MNIEEIQDEIGALLRTVEGDLNRRGVIYLTRAEILLSITKDAKLRIAECESRAPAGCFSFKWRKQSEALRLCESRLSGIIRGTSLPFDDNERR
jgi:hypothetical protein